MQPYFEFEKLQAYQVARRLMAAVHGVAKTLRKDEDERDQIERQASSVMRNLAEGAGTRSGKEKARFYDYARRSAEECGASMEALTIRELVAPAVAANVRELLLEELRLVAGLIRSAERR